jgi:hypothetical protein
MDWSQLLQTKTDLLWAAIVSAIVSAVVEDINELKVKEVLVDFVTLIGEDCY